MTKRRADGNSVLAIIEAPGADPRSAPAGQEIPGRQVLLEARCLLITYIYIYVRGCARAVLRAWEWPVLCGREAGFCVCCA